MKSLGNLSLAIQDDQLILDFEELMPYAEQRCINILANRLNLTDEKVKSQIANQRISKIDLINAQLEALSVVITEMITDMSESQRNQINGVHINNMPIVSKSMLTALQHLPNLRSLHFDTCGHIAYQLTTLRQLKNLQECHLNEVGGKRVKLHCCDLAKRLGVSPDDYPGFGADVDEDYGDALRSLPLTALSLHDVAGTAPENCLKSTSPIERLALSSAEGNALLCSTELLLLLSQLPKLKSLSGQFRAESYPVVSSYDGVSDDEKEESRHHHQNDILMSDLTLRGITSEHDEALERQKKQEKREEREYIAQLNAEAGYIPTDDEDEQDEEDEDLVNSGARVAPFFRYYSLAEAENLRKAVYEYPSIFPLLNMQSHVEFSKSRKEQYSGFIDSVKRTGECDNKLLLQILGIDKSVAKGLKINRLPCLFLFFSNYVNLGELLSAGLINKDKLPLRERNSKRLLDRGAINFEKTLIFAAELTEALATLSREYLDSFQNDRLFINLLHAMRQKGSKVDWHNNNSSPQQRASNAIDAIYDFNMSVVMPMLLDRLLEANLQQEELAKINLQACADALYYEMAVHLFDEASPLQVARFAETLHTIPAITKMNQAKKHNNASLQWRAISNPAKIETTDAEVWELKSLTSAEALRTEGAALSHCVGGSHYASQCIHGDTHILAIRNANGTPDSTVELALRSKDSVDAGYFYPIANSHYGFVIVQHYARGNTQPSATAKAVLQDYLKQIETGKIKVDVDALLEAKHKRIQETSGDITKVASTLAGYDVLNATCRANVYKLYRSFLPTNRMRENAGNLKTRLASKINDVIWQKQCELAEPTTFVQLYRAMLRENQYEVKRLIEADPGLLTMKNVQGKSIFNLCKEENVSNDTLAWLEPNRNQEPSNDEGSPKPTSFQC